MLEHSSLSKLLAVASAALICLLFAPLAQAGWLPPVDVSDTSEQVGGPQVALDSAGNATAVWHRWNGDDLMVESAYRPAGAGWQDPTVLSEAGGVESEPGAHNAYSPRIAVDADGDVTVVWESYGGTNKLLVQTAHRPAGGEWQAPVDIGEVKTTMAPEPWIAVDAAGDATAVWKNVATIESAYRPAGGGWQTPVQISDPKSEAFVPQAAVNANGDATAVWMHFDGAEYVVQSAYRSAGGSWEAPALVSEPGEGAGNPHIALDGLGDAMVAWRGESGGEEVARAARRPAGGSWQAPVDVSTPGEQVQALRIALDAGGDAMAVWSSSKSEVGAHAVAKAAYRPAGAGWEAPVELSEGGENAYPSDVAFDADGNAAVVWSRLDGANNIVQAAYKPAEASWEAPVNLSKGGEDSSGAVVVLGASGESTAAEGAATAMWTSAAAIPCQGKSPCHDYSVQAAGYDAFDSPAEGLEVPEEGAVGAPVEVSVPPENIWSPMIEFGDGTSAASTSATHTYAAPGEYTVSFSGTEVLGYESSAQRTIVIGAGDGEPNPGGSQPHPEKGAPPGDDSPAQTGPPSAAADPAGAAACPTAKAARERALRRLRLRGSSPRHAASLRKAKRRLAQCVARHTG